MANQILAGAVFQAGQVLAGIDADNILDTFIAPSTTSSTVANKILMWNSDYAHSVNNNGIYSGSTSQGGLFMTDAAFANPLTLSPETPQSVAAGEGKVVSISMGGEISVYNSSTGALETTFTDTLLDNGKASEQWSAANCCAIGAGKIFINSPEHNAAGVGSIIVVDLLDRNVPSFLITPALGSYSRLGQNSNGKLQFVDGKVVAGTSQWSAPDRGIHIFDPDGSNHTFIPTSFAPYRIEKLGDNYVASNSDSGVEILDISGQVLHSKNVGSYGFGYDIGVTSTNKLVVRRHSHQGGGVYEQFVHIYDEGFTNEIIISGSAQPSTSGGTTPEAAFWCHETLENCAGFTVFGEDILVAAPKASSDTVNESGAIYRYNDSGVLQEIFYGTVAGQRLGVNIVSGKETTTTALPSFIAPSSATTSQEVIVRGQQHYNSNMGRVIVYSAVDNSIISTIDGTEAGRALGTQVLLTDDYILASTAKGVWDDDTTSSIHAYSTSDLTADPIIIGHPLGKGTREFGQAEGQLAVGNGKLFINEGNRLYICDLSNLSAAPVPFEFDSSEGGFDSTGNLNLAQAILVFNPYDNYLYVGQKNAYGGDGAITRLDTNTMLTTGGSPETIYSVDAASISSMNFGTNIAIFEDCLYVSGKHAEGSPIRAVYKYNTSSFVSGHTAVPHLSKWSGSTQSLGSNDDFGSYIGSISASSKGTIIGAPNYGASDWNGGYVNTGRVYYIENYSNGTSGGLTPLNTSSLNLQHNEWVGDNVYTDENYVYATFYGRSFSSANAVAVWSWDNISAAPTIIETESGNGIDIGSLVSREALPTFIAPPTSGGSSTSITISQYIVGSINHDISSSESNSGAVYVFDATDTTAQPIKLVHPEYGDAGSRAGDKFGFAISSISGKIAIGAPFHDDPYQSGSAYIYDSTDLTATPTRLAPGEFQDKFGVSVAMTDSKIVVGAPRDDDGANGPGSYVADSGAVYVYDSTDLTATPTQLKAPDAEAYDYFGDVVSANSDKIAITAIYGDETSSDTGAVYVYDSTDLTAAPTKLTAVAADGTDHANLHFGKALAMSSSKLAVGTMDDTDASNSGSVYVYDLNDLSATPSKLMPSDPMSNLKFGSAIAATADKIIVGDEDDDNGSYSGSIYVYDANDLSAQPTKVTAFDGAEDDHFGCSLAAVSNTLLVGSWNDDGQGSTYIYDLGDLSAQPTKITAFDGASGDRFSASVAIG